MLAIKDLASFGDLEDIFRKGIFTNHLGNQSFKENTTRSFLPGEYCLHVLSNNAVVVCERSIDPQKIHTFLKASNHGEDSRLENYIHRHDWMHYRDWGSDCNDTKSDISSTEESQDQFDKYSIGYSDDDNDANSVYNTDESLDSDYHDKTVTDDYIKKDLRLKAKQFKKLIKQTFIDSPEDLIYFVNYDRLDVLESANICFDQSRTNKLVYYLFNKSDLKELLGFMIDGRGMFQESDWRYGCVFVDMLSSKCFALVIESCYTERDPAETQTINVINDVTKTNYVYDMHLFQF